MARWGRAYIAGFIIPIMIWFLFEVLTISLHPREGRNLRDNPSCLK
jgi:hypothetical protein